MGKDQFHSLKGIRSNCLRILKTAFVHFIALSYGITTSVSSMSPDAIEVSPATHFKLLSRPNGDFMLVADGDVKIRKFSSPENLIIQTPGIVTFAEDGLVGALLDIDAKHILIAKGARLKGKKAHFQAHQKVHIGGSLESEEDVTIKAAEQINVHGALSSRCGTLDLYGSEFNNFGDVETSKGIRGDIGHFKNHNLFRTKGNLILHTRLFDNLYNARTGIKGRLFAFGLLNIENSESYVDAGEIYSPLLSTVSARSIQFLSTHRFYGNEIDIRACKIISDKGSNFYFQNSLHFCSYLDSFVHYGNVVQVEPGLFPYYKDYFLTRRLPANLLTPDLGELTETLHLNEYDVIKNAIEQAQKGRLRAALTYNVKGDFERKGKDSCLSGTPIYQIGGTIISDGFQVLSGLFTTDEVLVQAARMVLKNTSFKSYGAAHLVSRGCADFDEVAVQADTEAHIDIKDQLVIPTAFRVYGTEGASIQSASTSGSYLDVNSEQGVAHVRTRILNLKEMTVGPQTIIESHKATVDALSASGDTLFQVNEISLEEVDLKGELKARADKVQVGPVHAQGVAIQTDEFTATGPIKTTEDTLIDGRNVHMKEGASVDAGGQAIVRATESYTDHPTTQVSGTKGTILYAPQTIGFLGTINSAVSAELCLKDMGLDSILTQVKAPQTEAHLDVGIHVDRDLNITQNLYVFAKSFENKAIISAPAGFVIHMVSLFGKSVERVDETI